MFGGEAPGRRPIGDVGVGVGRLPAASSYLGGGLGCLAVFAKQLLDTAVGGSSLVAVGDDAGLDSDRRGVGMRGSFALVVPDRGKRAILAIFVLLIPLPLVVLAAVGGVGEPLRLLLCTWQSRDGWTVEHPRDPVTETEFREFTEQETSCVDVEAVYVNTGLEDDGIVVEPRGARSWFGRGKVLTIRVEAPPGDDIFERGEPLSDDQPGVATELLSY